jgi:hypothetical protein
LTDLKEHEQAVWEMVRRSMSDAQMAKVLGVTSAHVSYIRSKLGIPAGRKPGGWQGMRAEIVKPPEEVQPVDVYEENGVTVKVYPARWAETLSWGKRVR